MRIEFAREIIEKTRNDFDQIAPEFSLTRRYLWPELINLFRHYVKDNDIVLDIGCGNGRLLDLFIGLRVNYVGIDSSEGQIDQAIRRYPGQQFIVANALDLPFENNVFDKVFAIAVLHEIPSKEFRQKFLEEAYRVLKENGLLFLTVWDLRKRIGLILKYSFLKLIKRSGLDKGDVFIPWGREVKRYYHVFGKNEIKKLVKAAGFEIIEQGIAYKPNKSKANLYIIARKPALS